MKTDQAQSIVIDASTEEGAELLPVLSQLLCAATPEKYGFDQIFVLIDDEDTTDWPNLPWLTCLRLQSAPTGTSSIDEGVLNRSELTHFIEQHHSCPFITLNSSPRSHPNTHVIVSDNMAAKLAKPEKIGGLFDRIRHKVTAQLHTPNFTHAQSLVGFSCYATSMLAQLDKPIHTVPMGVSPAIFSGTPTHPLIDNLNAEAPFVWLTALTDERTSAVLTCIEAARTLCDFGAFLQLKILMPESADGKVLTTDAEKTVVAAAKGLSFVEIVTTADEEELIEQYRHANGFVWGYRTDRNYRHLLYALAAGLPTIAPNTEMVKKHTGKKLRFFMAYDSNDLANTMERSMADIHFRIIGSSRNHRQALGYTWEKTAAEFFRLVGAYQKRSNDDSALAS